MTSLQTFFEPPHFEKALARYVEVAQRSRAWSIADKLDMYNWAKVSFASSQPEVERLRAFSSIYDTLRAYWQVFRNARGRYWSANETFDALTSGCAMCSRHSKISLMTLRRDSEESDQVLTCLGRLQGLKPNKDYPWVPVAKFSHFYNPMLFPIYDNEVIWKKVLNGAFRTDYRQWCERHRLARTPPDAHFYLHYVLWAAETMQQADSTLMAVFSEWFKARVSGHTDQHGVENDVHEYYATAFEFVAIGSAYLHE